MPEGLREGKVDAMQGQMGVVGVVARWIRYKVRDAKVKSRWIRCIQWIQTVDMLARGASKRFLGHPRRCRAMFAYKAPNNTESACGDSGGKGEYI